MEGSNASTEDTLSPEANGHHQESVEKPQKNPWEEARKYQKDLCRKALEENVIVYLGTGCGKTRIATLLIYEMGHLIKKPQKNICIFLAPTVALVQQQAKVIEDAIDYKVGMYCGSSHLKRSHDWEKEIEKYEVFVMTPQILVHNLSHCFMRMEFISLLIFDECHYAQLESNHPYAEIMKVFYKPDAPRLPRIFGMTASPKLGKGASIDSLESLLHSKVYSVEDNSEFEQFVFSPKVNIYYYGPGSSDSSSSSSSYLKKLEVVKDQCVSELHSKSYDNKITRSAKKALVRLHGNIVFCLESLGVWGALQACQILLKGDEFEQDEMVKLARDSRDDSSTEKYLMEAASVLSSGYIKDDFTSELSSVEVLTEPFFSRKLLRLIGILSNFGLQPNMKCIVFVNRIITARSLSIILRSLNFLSSWKCDFLVGLHSGLKSMSLKKTNSILEKFRSGELNLLVATRVGEEGLDIQTCCLVVRFDLPDTVSSFIQSRGRARMPQSEYAFLVDSGNQREISLIEHFTRDEEKMNAEIASRETRATVTEFDERTYKVEKTGATISMVASVALLHRYCSKLPRDEYFIPKLQKFYFDDVDGMICHIILPSNAPIHQIASAPQPSIEEAKRDACLKACKALHEIGALTDFLLPEQQVDEESSTEFSDSDCSEDEDTRRELHEMHVPNTLKKAWTADLDNLICIQCYYIKFCPNPPDRLYTPFGLFMKAALPREAENLKLVLHLARGRDVMVELIPSGIVTFAKEEMVLAEKFQTMTFKIILDRSQLAPEFVSLESSNGVPPTFYLLLPVLLDDDKVSVNWKLIERCLSSPIFQSKKSTGDNGNILLGESLQLANGLRNINDVVNSLIYVPCKNTFYFVSDVVREKNGHSSFKGKNKSHVEHYMKKFKIEMLHPNQPLLRVKQLFVLDNLLRKKGYSEVREKEEHFVEVPPEICQLKVIGFSKAIGSSMSLLPSFMHRLESLLVAIDLKEKLSSSFPEGSEVTANRILEALTTEKCHESFSLERLEVLGDAFLKFVVGRHLFLSHDALDEGQLTTKRSNMVNNSNLLKLALRNNLQVYIQDQMFDPNTYYVLGRPCPVVCDKKTEKDIHSAQETLDDTNFEIRCNKCHHWLHKKTIADGVEALVGAFIVDSGFKAAIAFLKWIGIHVAIESTQVSRICLASTVFLPLAKHTDVSAMESALGYRFVHKGLLIQAIVHPSTNNHMGGCYQRLEFLGDAVLDYLITSYLYSVYPNLKPGQLTDLRSASVNNISFADIAVRLSFYKHIICNSSGLLDAINKYVKFIETSGPKANSDQEPHCPKALGDLVESCMGAILLDSGFDLNLVWNIMLSMLDPVMSFSKLRMNPARELQELCQSFSAQLDFSSQKKGQSFAVEGTVNGKGVPLVSCATGRSIKAAKKTISQELLSQLKAQGHHSKSKSLEEVLRNSPKMQAKLIGHDEKCHETTAEPHDLKMQIPVKNGYTNSTPEEVSPSGCEASTIQPSKKPDSNGGLVNSRDRVSSNGGLVNSRDGASSNGGLVNSRDRVSSNGGLVDSRDKVSSNGVHSHPRVTGTLRTISAKSRLYELCAINWWKPPTFVCFEETGPSHLKEFIFKVVVEIEEAVDTIVECYGHQKSTKKEAAESAAQAALWFLKHEDYIWDEKCMKPSLL